MLELLQILGILVVDVFELLDVVPVLVWWRLGFLLLFLICDTLAVKETRISLVELVYLHGVRNLALLLLWLESFWFVVVLLVRRLSMFRQLDGILNPGDKGVFVLAHEGVHLGFSACYV